MHRFSAIATMRPYYTPSKKMMVLLIDWWLSCKLPTDVAKDLWLFSCLFKKRGATSSCELSRILLLYCQYISWNQWY